MKKILTVYTGGTICCEADGKMRNLNPKLAKRALISNFSAGKSKYSQLTVELFEDSNLESKKQTLSENMTLKKLSDIIEHIKSFDLSKYCGVIVMHGTDTLAFTASIFSYVFSDIDIPMSLMLLCSIVMAAGTAMGGKKIIKSVGMDMVKLEKYQGFSADIAGAISLLFCSVFGLPVSTTHAKTTSIMGVGAVKRVSAINFGVVKEMVLTWVLTFPGCGLVGFLMTKLFMWIFI